MNEKKIGLIIVIMLICTTMVPFVSSTNTDEKNENHDEIFNEYYEKDCGCNQPPSTLYINENEDEYSWCEYPLMREYIPPTDPESLSPKPTIVDTPDEFSWIDYNGEDWTSPISDQGACGSCWLFAAIGCLECILNVREQCPNLDIDLSEQYVLSCLPEAGSCRGGVANSAFRLINATSAIGNYVKGIIPESCFKYHGIDRRGWDYYQPGHRPILCEYKCDDWEDHLIPISNHGYYRVDGSPEDIARIKSQVYTSGPVVTTMAVSRNFGQFWRTNHSPDDYYPYEAYDNLNHNVVIVGWKDDPAIPNGGFWRIKNSWGKTGGYDGFFNIEYGSLHIDDDRIQWVDYDPESYTFKPKLDIGGPYYGDITDTITFDASGSFAPETTIISYHWDFGDGAEDTGVIVNHDYSHPGVYTVTLTVKDDLGNIVTDKTAAIIQLWKVNDSWTYKLEDIELSIAGPLNVSLSGSIENLKVTVSEVTDDYYLFNIEGELTGKIYYRIQKLLTDKFFNPGILVTKGGKMSGTLKINKMTLGMDDMSLRLSGSLLPIIGIIPLTVPLPFDITLMNEFDGGYKILDFPLEIGYKWDLPTNFVTLNTKFESTGLNLFKIIDSISKIVGMSLFPENLVLRIRGRPDLFVYTDEKSIDTSVGTFDTYEISFGIFDDELLTYYYAPEIGAIVKISGDAEDFQIPGGTLSLKINGELIATNYQN